MADRVDELLAGYPRYYPTYLRQLLLGGRAGALHRNFEGFRAQQGDLSRMGLWRELATPFWPDWLRRAARVAGRAVRSAGAMWTATSASTSGPIQTRISSR